MRFATILTPALLATGLVLALPSCGKEAEASFTSVAEAQEAGAKAKSTKDYPTARSAFQYVADQSADDPAALYNALLNLGEVQAASYQEAEAEGTFNRVSTELKDQLDVAGIKRICSAWIHARQPERVKASLDLAKNLFPDDMAKLDKEQQALTALESGDEAALASLGYVGD
ncbi:MAG: hypothetical protein DWQ01_16025 [Planctomycetota bacterium]|nr:MAG: hypothetical protein DWQ01_16025 [Planctomycetota bacterium]